MKVAVYKGVKSVSLEERPKPKAGPGEVIVRVKYCGICGTDLHAYLHEGLLLPGLILGHEIVGTVDEVGKGVGGWKGGERVVVGPPGPCGECYYCQHGQPNICLKAFTRTAGISPGFDGGMAEYVRVRYPKTMLFRIPDEVSYEDAVLIDTICVALRGIRASRFRLGDNVVVAGAGAIGLSAIKLLRMGGARHITVLQPSPQKRQMALEMGADLVMNSAAEGAELQKKVVKLYGGVGADVAYECAGSPQALLTLIGLVKSGGQVLDLGVTGEPTPIIEAELVPREIEIKASFVYLAEDVEICLDFLARRRFDTGGMVSDIIRLDDIVAKGFERLATSKGLVKVLLAP
jgi:threonine dehydrogenase-like Zn-dependent dehydrogenase